MAIEDGKPTKEEKRLLALAPRVRPGTLDELRLMEDPCPLFDDLGIEEPAWLDVKRRQLKVAHRASLRHQLGLCCR